MNAISRETMVENLIRRLSMPREQISIILALTAIASFSVSAKPLGAEPRRTS
ncbi:hypothetical protein BH24ACI3_BH24ACI3_07590 [soil metagenome]